MLVYSVHIILQGPGLFNFINNLGRIFRRNGVMEEEIKISKK